jgi:hypothetical protein
MKEQVIIPGIEQKVNEYVTRIQAGENKDTVLQGLPISWISAVEEKISRKSETSLQKEPEVYVSSVPTEDIVDPAVATRQKEEKLAKEQEQINSLREQLGAISKDAKFEGVENMAPIIEAIGKTHYLFTHQTEEGTAKSIFESTFHVSPGTGIASTMTWLGSEGVVNQIERQLQGDSHRGYKGMLIVAIPKEILDQQGGRNKAEALSDYLLESPEYGKDGNSDLVIPKEYNLGYLEGNVLHVSNSFIEPSSNHESSKELEPTLNQVNELLQKIDTLDKKSKEIFNKTQEEWYDLYGKTKPLDNQRFSAMNNQAAERFWDWVEYESGTPSSVLLEQYNNLVDKVSPIYEISNIHKLQSGVFASRSIFNINSMKESLVLLKENI